MQKKKKYKLNLKRVIIVALIIYFMFFLINTILNMPIKNIYIYNNVILSDQEIIDIAKLSNYPSYFKTLESSVKKRLNDNDLVTEVKVSKKHFSEIHIYVTETKVLFYNELQKNTVIKGNIIIDGNKSTTTLINYVPDVIYEELVTVYSEITDPVSSRVSEIEYRPSSVDSERFLLSMTDGNYVYVTLNTLTTLNEYIDIIKTFNGQKGILYLDAGAYFEVMEWRFISSFSFYKY